MDVTDGADQASTADQTPAKSDFKKYLEQHPEGPEELMKILVSLYNNPMKQSQIQPYLKELMKVQEADEEQAAALKEENARLQVEIYDMQDQLLALEKEYEEIKEEEEL